MKEDLKSTPGSGSGGSPCLADLIQAAWEQYHGPIIDDSGEEYIPAPPPAFMRGFVDGYEQGKKCRAIVEVLRIAEPVMEAWAKSHELDEWHCRVEDLLGTAYPSFMDLPNATFTNSDPKKIMTTANIVGSGTQVRRVWFTMVLVPTKGWTRVGKAYGSEKSARRWLRFVSQAWHGLRTKTAQCTLRWKDGVMDERSRRTLSEKFNMEPPAVPPNNQGEAQPPAKCHQ